MRKIIFKIPDWNKWHHKKKKKTYLEGRGCESVVWRNWLSNYLFNYPLGLYPTPAYTSYCGHLAKYIQCRNIMSCETANLLICMILVNPLDPLTQAHWILQLTDFPPCVFLVTQWRKAIFFFLNEVNYDSLFIRKITKYMKWRWIY
jgi:hypothetical protein